MLKPYLKSYNTKMVKNRDIFYCAWGRAMIVLQLYIKKKNCGKINH